MTVALEVMKLIIRDEFERDWLDRAEPFDGEADSVLVTLIRQTDEVLLAEAEEDAEAIEPDSWYWITSDEDGLATLLAKLRAEHWIPLISDAEADEFIAYAGDYLLKSTKECVAHLDMVVERIPSLRPVITDKLQQLAADIETMFDRLVDDG